MSYAVILAGGVGSRFWPFSRESEPKQFLCFRGNKSFLQQTIERILPVVPEENIYIIGSQKHKYELESQSAVFSIPAGNIILEPEGKNTAPAIGLAARALLRRDPKASMFVLPADHYIANEKILRCVLKQAEDIADNGYLVTLGIRPSSPRTGYGYIKIKQDGKMPGGKYPAYLVDAFVEKPDREKAEFYLKEGNYYWNSGMFVWKAKTILNEISGSLPELDRQLDIIDGVTGINPGMWGKIIPVSVDYGVLEKSNNTAVIIAEDIGWSDLGSLSSMADILPRDEKGNVFQADSLDLNSENTAVFGDKRLIVTIGLRDMIVSDTQDALLICEKSKAEKVKDVVRILNERNRPERSFHKKVKRPWGSYTLLNEDKGFKVKCIEILPHKRLSLQRHKYRSEHWIVVEGTARVTNNGDVRLLDENESTYIPKLGLHRLENPGERPLKIIEVQCGSYIDEDDIERLEDDYARTADS